MAPRRVALVSYRLAASLQYCTLVRQASDDFTYSAQIDYHAFLVLVGITKVLNLSIQYYLPTTVRNAHVFIKLVLGRLLTCDATKLQSMNAYYSTCTQF